MSEGQPVRWSVEGAVGVIRIDRPAARNALSRAVLDGIVGRLETAQAADDVRAVVLTGGVEVFSAGADVAELSATSPAQYLLSATRQAYERIASFRKPIVAAVAGYALGGGCEIATACDLVVAGDDAVFGQPEITLGIIPGAGGTQRWTRAAGAQRGMEAVLRGRLVDAWTAWRIGLVNAVVPSPAVVDAALAMATEIAGYGPVAARLGKEAVRASERMTLAAALDHEAALMAALLSTDDYREGTAAFLEKRPARFAGR